MFARTTILQLKPEKLDQAIYFIQEIMLPSASKQQGFRGALLLKHAGDTERYIIVSLWETERDMLASKPPDELLPQVEAFGELIAESNQGTYEVLLSLEKPR